MLKRSELLPESTDYFSTRFSKIPSFARDPFRNKSLDWKQAFLTPLLRCRRRINKRRLRAFLWPDFHFHRLLAKSLMHRGNRVFTRRKVLNLKASVGRAHGKIW